MRALGALPFLPAVLGRVPGYPVYLTYFITDRCNASCSYCFYRENLNTASAELDLDEIGKVASSMDDLLFLLLSGGEPFIREEMDRIAGIFYRHNRPMYMIIPTNGILTDVIVQKTSAISSYCRGTSVLVSVSLDGPEEVTDRLRGVPGSFRKSMATLKGLSGLKSRNPNLSVGINITLTSLNQPYVLEFYRYIRQELAPDLVSVLLFRNERVKDPSLEPDLAVYRDLQEMINLDQAPRAKLGNLAFSGLVSSSRRLRSALIYETARRKKFLSRCYAGITNGVLYPSGEVSPCETLDVPFGNIRDNGLDMKRVWKGPAARRFRTSMRENRCFCTHECNWTSNILFNPGYLPALVKGAVSAKKRG